MENKQLALVTFEQAQRLKNAGFDWPTSGVFCGNLPTSDSGEVVMRPLQNHNGDNSNDNIMQIALMGYRICSAPTVALALQYMRQEHNLSGEIWRTASGWMWEVCKADNGTNISHLDAYDNRPGTNDGGAFDNFDDCASDILDELLNMIDK